MIEKIIIAGAGGQGIILLGKVLAWAALFEKRHTTCLPTYGAEVRGGSAYCMVVISDREIASPYIAKADTSIIMNEPSWLKFKDRLSQRGLLLINNSLLNSDTLKKKSATICAYPFTDIAAKLGNIKIANMVALGAYLARKRILKLNSVLKAMQEIAPPDKKDLIEINKKALFAGMELIK